MKPENLKRLTLGGLAVLALLAVAPSALADDRCYSGRDREHRDLHRDLKGGHRDLHRDLRYRHSKAHDRLDLLHDTVHILNGRYYDWWEHERDHAMLDRLHRREHYKLDSKHSKGHRSLSRYHDSWHWYRD